MDKLLALRIYVAAYYAAATQLRISRTAREWMETMPYRTATRAELERHATQSAAWASIGMMPAEALPLIAQGVTPEMVIEMDPQTDAERIERLADRIQMLRD